MPTIEKSIVSTIRDQVYQILKKKICDGYYTPNQRLQENEVAQNLNVSRSPVREAFRQLASDGLVVEIPNKGVFVRGFTPVDIEEVFELRVLIESYAIQKSTEHLTIELKGALEDCMKQLIRTHDENDLKKYIKYDTCLHGAIIQLSGNGLIESVYNKVHSLIQPFRIYSLVSRQRFDESILEHKEIVQCILIGDTEKAVEVNRIHLSLAKDKIIEYMSSPEYLDKQEGKENQQ